MKKRDVVVHEPGQGEAVWFLDNLITVKVRSDAGAPFGLVENAMPAGSHTPFHRHENEDEAWYVLEGRIVFHLEGGRKLTCGPGSYVHVPAGVAHGFRTETPTRLLVLSAPNGFVEFAREVGRPAERRELPPVEPPDVAKLAAVGARYGIEILGPLPA